MKGFMNKVLLMALGYHQVMADQKIND